MIIGHRLTPEKAQKTIARLGPSLLAEEVVRFVGTCNNIRPMVDRLLVTNLRLIAAHSDGTVKFQARHEAVLDVVSNAAKEALAVHTRDSGQLVLKMVPAADHPAVIEQLNHERSTPLAGFGVAPGAVNWSTYPQQASSVSAASTALPWWQTWYAIVPGLLLCLPLGLIGLWLRQGTSQRTKVVVTAATAVLFAVVLLSPDESDSPPRAESEESTPSSTPSATPASSAPAEPVLATVPTVDGLDLASAKQALRDAGLRLGSITRKPSAKPPGTVIKQDVRMGNALDPGSPVSLTVTVPFPRLPGVVGEAKASAISLLKQAGYKVETIIKTRTSGTDGAVLNQAPAARMRARPGSVVRIAVADVVEPAPVPAASNCSTGYEPCLTPMSDYDCAGGSGDGPGYASGPIYVTGSDPYDLDSEGDGIACE